jgi:hypothetical protein
VVVQPRFYGLLNPAGPNTRIYTQAIELFTCQSGLNLHYEFISTQSPDAGFLNGLARTIRSLVGDE